MGTVRMYPEPTGEVRMSLSLRFAAGSHVGMIRDHNEDSGYAGPRLLAVADGMGGQAAGEVASSEVISTIVELDEDIPGSDILTSLGSAVQRANEQLRDMVEEDPQLEGMGTTLTALLWTGQRLGLVHVGDSRAYLLRDGVLTQITQDHTWVQRLVDEGRITEEEATTHPQRSLLMRALGSSDNVESDLSIREVRVGDRYLLCSDGLSGVVSHQTMEETLASYHGPREIVEELIQLALRGGGPDNITVIIADVLDVDDNDTLAAQLNDTPVIVGAVAENQHATNTANAPGGPTTPAARAAELSRQTVPQQAVPAQEGFGPPGSGSAGSQDGGGAYDAPHADEGSSGKGARWFKRILLLLLVLALLGGGLYAGWRWTKTQYYVGVEGDKVALYQGISQKLGPVELSQVRDSTDIELKYLPPYRRNQVRDTIAMSSLSQAQDQIGELREQAEVCELVANRKQSAEEDADSSQPGTDSGGSTDASGSTQDGTSQNSSTPSPGPELNEEQQRLAKMCRTP
ncbi:Stp1/IreP family PP2C-type Ser/Thr phosphatase [Streptomyces sp. 549]|uniref:Stp1/IreP family PP2C-type Ser/Thr phosphatase n=1 Tax=Streptomyces sp. 549 TaxID=3049076 RepID=UPI0024C29BAE|nr:Stp1/IreP family PP2C-type Ser/Thr phosphatase [Streptomyces sp. 549]MDK1473252.1 Stp1/IreP family PP2C-type Ser/Thr phosphatase [Streptomyces sp. 549]